LGPLTTVTSFLTRRAHNKGTRPRNASHMACAVVLRHHRVLVGELVEASLVVPTSVLPRGAPAVVEAWTSIPLG
jgi:hypothetical protein